MITIKFLKDYEPYEAGHVVDMDDKQALKLIKENIARAYRATLGNPKVTTTGGEK